MAPNLVRVLDKSLNREFTVSAERARQLAERGGVEILTGVAATDTLGRALPPTTATATKSSKENAR